MNKLNPTKVGLAVGGLLGVWHVVWSLMVAVGWAQPLINFSFRLHMISSPPQVQPFSLGAAIFLVIMAVVIGYVVGNVFTFIWNWLHR